MCTINTDQRRTERKKERRRRLMQVENCNLFPMAPVPSSVVTTLQSPSPLPPPLACKTTLRSSPLLLPFLVASLPRHGPLPLLSPLILETYQRQGQPHLLACPQDINRTQRLVSAYIHAFARARVALPIDRYCNRNGRRSTCEMRSRVGKMTRKKKRK